MENNREMTIHIDGYSFNDVLGPEGENYVTVWFHGCHRNCKGCIAGNWNDKEAVFTASSDFVSSMVADEAELRGIHIDGFVISGGEPFIQAEGVVSFLEGAAAELGYRPGVMVYTGYTLDELELLSVDSPCIGSLLGMTDILVDGEYIEELDMNTPYAGSINQKMHFLSDRYSVKDFPDRERRTYISFPDEAEFMMVGIPSTEAKRIWKDIGSFMAPK